AAIRERFQREGYAANRVGHSGAVGVLDDDVSSEGSPFLVMELLIGETLDERARRKGGTLDARDVLSVIDKTLDVLTAAHDNGIIHRDLKPENIFITQDKTIKVLDFGIAGVREAQLVGTRVTQAGLALGSPAFMPPEQARARWDEVDARSDLWALGATAFSSISGEFVHRGSTPQELMILSATSRPRSLKSVMVSIPTPIADFVDRALAFRPDDRYPSAPAMQDALREAYYAVEQGTGVAVASSRERPPERALSVVVRVPLHLIEAAASATFCDGDDDGEDGVQVFRRTDAAGLSEPAPDTLRAPRLEPEPAMFDPERTMELDEADIPISVAMDGDIHIGVGARTASTLSALVDELDAPRTLTGQPSLPSARGRR
ncbi:MAG: serine/threonine-protein kinase, partial [Myxococcales bacterium]